jgi:hypothetical protein
MAKTYYLISTAGYPNFGDEQIVRTWLSFFRKYDPNAQVILDVPFASRAGMLFRDEFANLQIVDTLWNMIDLLDVTHADLADLNRHKDLLTGGDPRNTLGIRLIESADVIHILGGGYFDVTNRDFQRTYHLFPMLAAAKSLHPDVRLIATGIGLTPISEIVQAAIEPSLAVFDHVGVRDTASAEVAGTTLEADDVFMSAGLNALRLNVRNDSPDILLSLQPMDDDIRDSFVALLVAFLRQPEHQTKRVGVIEAMVPEDNWPYISQAFDNAPDVKDRMTFYSFWDIWRRGLPVKPKQQWVTTRFHMHLVGALLGYKGTAVSVGSTYYNTKHQSLLNVGTGWQFLASPEQAKPIAPNSTTREQEKLMLVGQQKIDAMRELYHVSI